LKPVRYGREPIDLLNELKKFNIGKAAEDARPLDFPKRPGKDRESPGSRSLYAGLSIFVTEV
jgi:hypothetical protein